MGDISKRLAALTPRQQRLLELRLKKEGLSADPAPQEVAGAAGVIEGDEGLYAEADFDEWKKRPAPRGLDFSLYFFSDDGSKTSDDKYRLLLESARFADAHGFRAVWTPERHFQDFGGLYPNPSILSAALAVITERVQIRAGSVALPLHHPIRTAEEWAVVDNLSKGRVAVSIASGWHPTDFVFAPQNYEDRKQVMFDYLETIQRLWSGEPVKFKGAGDSEVEVRILPRPIQPRLPIWITTAGSAQTWIRAGEVGANILAALVGYSLEDLAERIRLYREARAGGGHDPARGQVTVMAHTFLGDDNQEVKEKVRAPLCHYLRSYFNQFADVGYDAEGVTEEDKNTIVAKAFDHYFATGTLIGTPNKCSRLVDRLIETGVDEIACLIDFGLDIDSVMGGLRRLDEVRAHYAHKSTAGSQ
ncbi:MAG TPA: LLM class flavin-dependent oxidoreductase [Blastocatellia bacterium]|jgi:natural product biosynthesis luciferase-like monooxygenase protein